jgi:hypothetical protein
MSKGSPFPTEQKGLTDRALSLFTDVRAGEGVGALLLALNVFYLLAFYQVLKIVRDALILSESGAVAASYASAGMAAALFVFVPAYGALASRVNRVWLISSVTACSTWWQSPSSGRSPMTCTRTSAGNVCFQWSASARPSVRSSARA